MRFGMLQSKVALTVLLKNYNVTLNKKTTTPIKFAKRSFLSKADGGVWLNFEKV
jgi:cytochrome P450 family 6